MSNMDTILHAYLCKLKIIAKLPVNGKFDTTNNDLNIYYGSMSGWIWRKFQGDGKENATRYLQDLYRDITTFADQTMHNIRTETSQTRRHKKMVMLVSLTEKLKESITGINNLGGTYKNYIKTSSLLECLNQDIITPLLRTLYMFIPITYHTDSLKNDFTYNKLSKNKNINKRTSPGPVKSYSLPQRKTSLLVKDIDLNRNKDKMQSDHPTLSSLPIDIPGITLVEPSELCTPENGEKFI